MDCSPPGPSVHGDSPGKNTGVGCHALIQGIFPTQESNPCLSSLALASSSLALAPPGKPLGNWVKQTAKFRIEREWDTLGQWDSHHPATRRLEAL